MEKIKNNILKILFIIVSILLAIPSIIYLIKDKNIANFNRFNEFIVVGQISLKVQAICYFCILLAITILYFLIVKKSNKIFENIKKVYIFIAIISAIFIFVLPSMSSDVYYYMGTGRLISKYHENPYYISMREYIEENEEQTAADEILQKGVNYWGEATVVYGPVWPIICAVITFLSCGSLNAALFIFKLLFVALHILNCYFIYNITRRKKFVLLYGLNPFILLEAIAGVHNDLVVITFIFASLYFLLKKKNLILSVITLSMAAAIKYFTILLLPFIILYYFRKENLFERFKKCIRYGILFVLPIMVCYLIFFRDFEVLKGVLTQQSKLAKSIYILIYVYAKSISPSYVSTILLYLFILFFAIICINMLTEKKIKFITIMKKYNVAIFLFLFLLITNFQPWYIMWLFPTMMWQKSKVIKQIIGMSILSQFGNILAIICGDSYLTGAIFAMLMIVGSIAIFSINSIIEKRRKHVSIKD